MKLKPDQLPAAFQLLKGIRLFEGCPDEAIQAMVASFDAREVLAGKVVLMDQEIGRTLFILAKGSVGVWKRTGGDKKRLAVLRSPDFFGERSMFEESPASALVKTEEDSQIYTLDRNAFVPISVKFPAMMEPLKRNMDTIRAQRIVPPSPSSEP
jgi:CRP/FNR family transcriptional regulator, cyclic AMP receptor protein